MSYFPLHTYLRRPPPERPPPPRDPILEEPRELLARAWLPLIPEAPPNALRFVALRFCDTCRLPTRSPPPPRFISLVPALGPAPRFAPRPAGCCPARGLEFCRALACRLDMESPRVVPPYRVAVAWSEYGAPPRCWGLCCHVLPPEGSCDGRLPAPPTPPTPPTPPAPPTPPGRPAPPTPPTPPAPPTPPTPPAP